MIPEKPEVHDAKALTSIHGAYTLATADEKDNDEVYEIAVKHFLNALAEVALAVASRQVDR